MSPSDAPNPSSADPAPGDSDAVLTRGEELKIAIALKYGFGQRQVTEDEIEAVCEWARRVRIDQTMLELLLDGLVLPVGFRERQPVFRAVEGAMSPVEVIQFHAGLDQVEQRYARRPGM